MSQIVEKWWVYMIWPLLNKIWRMAAVTTNSTNVKVWPAGVAVSTVKRFETQFASVTSFPSLRQEEDTVRLGSLVSGNLYHQLDPSRAPLSSTKTKHWPQISRKTRKRLWRTLLESWRRGVGWLKRCWNISAVYLRFNKSQWSHVMNNNSPLCVQDKHPLIFIISNLHKTKCFKKAEGATSRTQNFLLADVASFHPNLVKM